MKLNRNPTARNHEHVPDSAPQPTPRTGGTEAPSEAGGPERFRRLKWNEVVFRGDFVEDGNQGFELWSGPGGFQADTFVKPIYRRKETGKFRATATGKSKRTTNTP